MDYRDIYYSVGDINCDGKPELVVQGYDAEGNQYIALLGYDTASNGLKTLWEVSNKIPGVGNWFMHQEDSYYNVGDINGDGKTELLVQSHYAGSKRYIGLLGYDAVSGGLKTLWVQLSQIPNGWTMDIGDSYYNIGDINGDGKTELLVQSHYGGSKRYIALLGYDAASNGLKTLWIASNEISGVSNWFMHQEDSYYNVGDINGDGKIELLVQSHYSGSKRYIALLGYDAASDGLKTLWVQLNQIPGGWTMDIGDSYYNIGDINGDGKIELLVQSHYGGNDGSNRYIALLGYDTASNGLKVLWVVSNKISGVSNWFMHQGDTYYNVGDINGDGKTELLVQSHFGNTSDSSELKAGSVDLSMSLKENIPHSFVGQYLVSKFSPQDYDNYIALLEHEPISGGLRTLWVTKNQIADTWYINQTDTYYNVGDINGDDQPEFLVQSRYPGDKSFITLLGYDAASGALKAL